MPFSAKRLFFTFILGLTGLTNAYAGDRILATGGVTQIEGSAGGGLVPWGVLHGTTSDNGLGITAAASRAGIDDYTLDVKGVALNLYNRLEISFARQHLALDTLGGKLEQDIIGAKARLFGDVLYHPWGQWSLGVQHKRLDDFSLPRAVGARDDSGTDIYLAGSKLFFDAVAGRNLLLNTTLRSTQANQGGLLGFGGDLNDSRELVVEGSLGIFVTPRWLAGFEYRQKPDQLSFAEEEEWKDVFVAFVPNKHLSLTAAWIDLGSIAGLDDQQGGYLSLQVAY
ncbi:DUF3034 family protein [Halomonas sp. M20]|uniref:DUF3034 family protein n=1 Tax=Halomonas sp. M20 TaxID=2763264 RepID=UPI001D0A28E6|nr:DUF3034 family protein [Halomonas sp. M20]